MAVELVCMCVYVSFISTGIMNTTDELATLISKGNVAVLQTSDVGLLRHDSCRYKV